MSILSLGRRHPAIDAGRERWWNWNPYRQNARIVERQGRREGYVDGARDEHRVMVRRERRRSHPIVGALTLVAAASGIWFVGLAYETGSFASGGAVIDQKLAEWRVDVMRSVGRAGDQVGQTLSVESQQLAQEGA